MSRPMNLEPWPPPRSRCHQPSRMQQRLGAHGNRGWIVLDAFSACSRSPGSPLEAVTEALGGRLVCSRACSKENDILGGEGAVRWQWPDTGDNVPILSELLGKCARQHSWHGNGDTTNEDEDVVDTTVVATLCAR